MTDGYITIVESDELAGVPVREALVQQGYDVALFFSVDHLLAALGERAPCLILVGTLAQNETRRLVRALRGRHRTIPTVIMATGGQFDPAARVDIGGKPKAPDEVMRIVERFCPPPPARATTIH